MRFDISRSVVVFDLDDTLYREADYIESGVRHVCLRLREIFGKDVYSEVQRKRSRNPRVDWLAVACDACGIPAAAKESLLWMYRLHMPSISLGDCGVAALERIRAAAKFTAVLTDGRSVTQRLKLSALGLSDLAAYISEDYGDEKPSATRFLLIQEAHPADHYFYVADNVQKDFLGCKPLGWIGIGVKGDERSVHSQVIDGCLESAQPDFWVDDWSQLTSLLIEQRCASQ